MADIGFRGKGKDNSRRKFPGERGPRADRAAAKRAEAAERNSRFASLPPAAQLASLDEWLGKGVGAKKQRARLLKKAA